MRADFLVALFGGSLYNNQRTGRLLRRRTWDVYHASAAEVFMDTVSAVLHILALDIILALVLVITGRNRIMRLVMH